MQVYRWFAPILYIALGLSNLRFWDALKPNAISLNFNAEIG